MDEAGANDAEPTDASDASGAITTTTAKRPAVTRRTRAGRGKPPRKRLAAQALLTLFAVLMIVGVAASLIESGWQSFNPINGIGVVGALPLQPQSFGDTATFTPQPNAPATGATAAISGQTRKPTAPPTATNVPSGGAGGSGSYPASFTGSWSGGVGQGCPGGGAPKPRTNVIYGASSYGAPTTNMVALTFDDGPTPTTSPPIISFLEQTHTPATFFVMGQYAHAYPWLVQREAADGFAIGVHTWDHPDMQLLSISARAYQLGATIQQLHADLGPNFCAWLWRPPYGSVNSGIVAQAGAFGLTTINWNVDPQDWSRPGTMVIVQRVLAQVRPGSIILLHDGPAARQQTAAALPYILAGLQARGLVPVTVPTLLGSESAATGPVVTPTPSPTATATATATPSPTATATDTPTPAPTATDTPTTSTGATGSLAALTTSPSGSILDALDLRRWGWGNADPGYSSA